MHSIARHCILLYSTKLWWWKTGRFGHSVEVFPANQLICCAKHPICCCVFCQIFLDSKQPKFSTTTAQCYTVTVTLLNLHNISLMHPIGIGLPVHCNKRRIIGLASYYIAIQNVKNLKLTKCFYHHNYCLDNLLSIMVRKEAISQTTVTGSPTISGHSPTISVFWIQLLNYAHACMSIQYYKDFYYICTLRLSL